MDISYDYRDLFKVLNRHRVKYLVVGAYAGVSINIIGKNELKKSKVASKRTQDLLDLEKLRNAP